jgi:hypothetical protein
MMDRKTFLDKIEEHSKASYDYVRNGNCNSLAKAMDCYRELLDWYDEVAPLIELGLATQQAQEQAQQE